MKTIYLLVGLKIPDTTAITTTNTLKELGYRIDKVTRLKCYRFEVSDEKAEDIKMKLPKTDILVNSNKNTYEIRADIDIKDSVIVKDKDTDKTLAPALANLGLEGIKSGEEAIIWTFHGAGDEIIKKATEDLLYNKHYQDAEYI